MGPWVHWLCVSWFFSRVLCAFCVEDAQSTTKMHLCGPMARTTWCCQMFQTERTMTCLMMIRYFKFSMNANVWFIIYAVMTTILLRMAEESFHPGIEDGVLCYCWLKFVLFLLWRIGETVNVTRLPCKKEFNYCCKVRPNATDGEVINKNPKPFPTARPPSPTTQPTVAKCGVQKPTFNQRILTKEPTTIPGEFPWIVAIVNKKSRGNQNYEFKCAGSIIHPRVVLTGVHCVKR